jgi:hypothetical protein
MIKQRILYFCCFHFFSVQILDYLIVDKIKMKTMIDHIIIIESALKFKQFYLLMYLFVCSVVEFINRQHRRVCHRVEQVDQQLVNKLLEAAIILHLLGHCRNKRGTPKAPFDTFSHSLRQPMEIYPIEMDPSMLE